MASVEDGSGPVKDSNISTHVLDTAKGVPAAFLKILLQKCTNTVEFNGENELQWVDLVESETDNDGRARFAFDLQPGIYKMVFYTFGYFERQAVPNFYPKVEVIFRISDVYRHYHVPLLISPYGYSTYRGS